MIVDEADGRINYHAWKSRANNLIALFTVNFSHLHYNAFERECEAISGRNCKIARNYLLSTFKNIVLQISKGNREKGNCFSINLLDVQNVTADTTCFY